MKTQQKSTGHMPSSGFLWHRASHGIPWPSMASGAGGVSALSQNDALGLPGPRCWRRIHCQRTPGGGALTPEPLTEIFFEFEVNDLSRMPRYVKYVKYWCYFWHGHSCCQCKTVFWIRHRWWILGSPWSGITSSSVPIARVNKTRTCNGDDVYHGNWDRNFAGVCGQLVSSMWGSTSKSKRLRLEKKICEPCCGRRGKRSAQSLFACGI